MIEVCGSRLEAFPKGGKLETLSILILIVAAKLKRLDTSKVRDKNEVIRKLNEAAAALPKYFFPPKLEFVRM